MVRLTQIWTLALAALVIVSCSGGGNTGEAEAVDRYFARKAAERAVEAGAAVAPPQTPESTPKAPEVKPVPREDPYAAIKQVSSVLGWVIGICMTLSALLAVASFVFQLLPTRGALLALAGSIGLALVRYAVIKYGAATAEVGFWATVTAAVAGVVFIVVPLALTWRHSLMDRLGKQLVKEGHPDAGVALQATARALPAAERKRRLRAATTSNTR